MVLAKQVTAEYCHINPVRAEISQGATEMPEQNQKNTNPATKPSNKMPLKILLFYCLSDLKKKPKKTTKWEKGVWSENVEESWNDEKQQSWSGENRGGFDHTHTNIHCGCTETFFPCLLLRRTSLKAGKGENTVNSILYLTTACVKGLGENWISRAPLRGKLVLILNL